MSDKLRITKNDIGKKIYKIELSEYMKEYFTVLASSEDEATEKMWDIKSGWTKDSQVFQRTMLFTMVGKITLMILKCLRWTR